MTGTDFLGPIGNATAKYEESNPIVRRLLERFLRRLDRAAESTGPNSILDVGCGEGIVTERLARLLAPATVLGVDADDAHLSEEWRVRSGPNLSFAIGSVYDLPFESDSFDLVCAIEVLEHLERPPDALAEMSRVASKALLLSVPNEPIWRISHMLAGRNLRALGDTPGHVNHWSKRAFAELVRCHATPATVDSVIPWTLVLASVREKPSLW